MKNKSSRRWVYLSYSLTENTSAYGGERSLKIEPDKSIKQGDSCNTLICSFSNHLGTHVDCPRHFDENGLFINDYSADFWIFNNPFLIDISPIKPNFIIKHEHFDFSEFPVGTDLILIKTGFCHYRGREKYWKKNPGFSPELANVFRSKFPRLRSIGIDSISISSFSQRELGRMAHQEFLCHPRPILLIEDMDLSEIDAETQLEKIIVSPLKIENADAAPCTIFAEIDQ